MSENKNNLCDINEFKKDKSKNKLLELARGKIKSYDHYIAMRISKTAYRLFPEEKDVIFNYAQALYLCGYENKAISLFEQIENYKEPYYSGSGVYFYLADCYCWQNKNLLKALKYINIALKIDKEYKDDIEPGLITKGRILYALGNYNSAILTFKKIQDFEDYDLIKIYLSKIYFKKGNYLKGYYYFKKLLDISEKEPFSYEEIQCYLDMILNTYTKENKIKLKPKIKKLVQQKLNSVFGLEASDFLIYSGKSIIGLKYDKSIRHAPFVVYKSKDVKTTLKEATKLKIMAFKSKFTNKIFETTIFGNTIDAEFFPHIAEIFALVYAVKGIEI